MDHVRGSSLVWPATLDALRPFVLTWWSGRTVSDMPADVRAVHQVRMKGRRASSVAGQTRELPRTWSMLAQVWPLKKLVPAVMLVLSTTRIGRCSFAARALASVRLMAQSRL